MPSYYAVHDCEEFCSITHDGPKLNRNYKDRAGRVIDPFNPKKNLLKLPKLLKMKKQLKKFGELLETKYKGYDLNGHRGVADGRYEGFAATPGREPVSGTNPNLKDLALPFRDFCKLNGVELVQDIWIGPFTAFGYGYFDEIPAGYVLKYLDFQTCMGSVLTNKYAEGYPGKRYYGGCEYVDELETIAIERAKKLFGAEFANVQPHSGAQANLEVYAALLKPGDTFLGMRV